MVSKPAAFWVMPAVEFWGAVSERSGTVHLNSVCIGEAAPWLEVKKSREPASMRSSGARSSKVPVRTVRR
jgi:hypothetical protein